MLKELSIKNFAIIEEVSVSFSDGLTVLTGETGAGKSIIIDAVHLLAGGRGSQEFIRHGAKKAELEGLFYLQNAQHPVFQKLQDVGIEADDDSVILRRDINDHGKSVCRVNGKLVTIAILREIGGSLIDIHGQHESQELMDERLHIYLLDQFAGSKIQKAKESYSGLFQKYMKLKKELASVSDNEQQIAQRIDLYQYQINEIDAIELIDNEDEDLQSERKKFQNYHKTFERISAAQEALNGESKGLDWIGNAMSELEDIASFDESYKEQAELVSNSFYSLQELSYQLKSEIDESEFDEERLNVIEDRLAAIQSLKRKYGNSISEIFAYRKKIGEELDALMNRDERIQQRQKALEQVEKDLEIDAIELTIYRKKAAKSLSEAIVLQLRELFMEKATFEVVFKPSSIFDKNGKDDVSFYMSTNVGEPAKPISKIASGGELSRMMLALKGIFSKHQGITSIIFDEVDTGVSGRVAQAIAEKIANISRSSQVLCITHLPQVAAMADQQLLIEKEVMGKRTMTKLTEVTGQYRVQELSRMMSGSEITTLTLEHATELLSIAEQRKKLSHV
ncbi:DNA repair protein RecN [Paenisporosarcina sp. OV554]|uniref:DNA repair protein RecN n=1 Tax=Paenisporosarcina sp. OV554 TaxID=2135694 RepID=UPI000D3CDCA1|nr:DNA repair protein RecN [Paenisporosarcina sp. OV554]PUB11195.1 DNA replication and repair protein RecN [Paenisporosarcina sp. OV554]